MPKCEIHGDGLDPGCPLCKAAKSVDEALKTKKIVLGKQEKVNKFSQEIEEY